MISRKLPQEKVEIYFQITEKSVVNVENGWYFYGNDITEYCEQIVDLKT